MNTLAERLKKALDYAGRKQRDLARHLGVSPSAVNYWATGVTKKLKASDANKAAEYLGVSARWLAEGVGEMLSPNIHEVFPEDETPEGFVIIPQFEIKVSAGNNEYEFSEIPKAKKVCYMHEWFVAKHVNPANCKRLTVDGDSMEPLLWDGDSITVDTAYQPIIDGKVYCILIDGQPRVKRLYKRLDGSIIIRSENSKYPDEVLPADQRDRLKMVGRVIDRSGGGMF